MECSCVRQTLIPGTSKLFADYLYDFSRVRPFFAHHFSDLDALVESASQIAYPMERRTALIRALREQNGESAALSKLGLPETVAVVTGQQVGLFSGPAYTILKALTALKLTIFLNEQGISAVPIFWLATEDHDVAEVNHAWVFDENFKSKKLSVDSSAGDGGPVGDVALTDVPIAELRASLGSLPFADEVVARVEAAYCPGSTFGGSFQTFLKELLGEHGLLFLDPLAPAMREIGAPLIAECVERAPELVRGLRQRDDELREGGYHSQVLVDEDASLLFLLTGGKRTPIRYRDGKFVTRERTFTADELRSRAIEVSPNALLRPVMQDFLLPTISYVAGPAEIAYFAQSEVLYRKLLGRMPVIFPRNSFTILDARAVKLLDRYHLTVPDLFSPAEEAKGRMAAKLIPPTLAAQFSAAQSIVSSSLAQLESAVSGFDPSLQAAAKKSALKMRYQMQKLARKASRATMLRDERAATDADRLLNLVYPQRRLQERFYSIIPFLAKYGCDLPDALLAETQLTCPDHMIRVI